MVARPSIPFRSANAGEFSRDAAGRIDVKQYYSAGLAFKGIEPVPQSGFRDMGGTRRRGRWRGTLSSLATSSVSTSAGPHTGTQTVWSATVSGAVTAVFVPSFTISAGTATFVVECQVDGVWTPMTDAMHAAAGVGASRLFARAPGQALQATAVRIRATFSTSATIALGVPSVYSESSTRHAPRAVTLATDGGRVITGYVTSAICDFYDAAAGYLGSAFLSSVNQPSLASLEFYSEGLTIGVFGPIRPQRIRLVADAYPHEWAVDNWPFSAIPTADLGGTYAQTNDQWEIYLRWSGNVELHLQISVDGQQTAAIAHTNNAGTAINADAFTNATWAAFATAIKNALAALPGLSAAVSVQNYAVGSATRRLVITFGGALSGREYGVSASVANTSAASAIAYHITRGKTDLEPLFSTTRGWPGAATLAQDRLVVYRIPATPGAVALSRSGEYFDFEIEGSDAAAAVLARLRSQTNETVLAVKEGTFVVVWTDRATYFVTNRVLDRNTPLNFQLTSETGLEPNCQPFDLEGSIYYVANGGGQLVSLTYDDVSTRYSAQPESLLFTHLMKGVMRTARQKAESDLDAARGWLMRSDGRLPMVQMIRNQEIIGACEWVSADGGLVREISVDHDNRLWLAVERGTEKTFEILDPAAFLQDSVSVTPNLAGIVSSLPYPDGTVLWAQAAGGFVLGPFTVAGGAIDLGDAYASATVGRWVAPRFESMPFVYVTRDDDILLRPGRIHTVTLDLIDTTSVAVGANGTAPRALPLAQIGDQADQPTPARTGLVVAAGLPGFAEGTTYVVTQLKPGKLRVRQAAVDARL